MKKYVLDSSALIAFLHDEDGADVVASVFKEADADKAIIIMHKLNLLEVYYDAYRSEGRESADLMLFELKKRPIIIENEITDEVFAQAGRLKASYKISLADSVALAQSIVFGGALLTADHHEFDIISKKENVDFAWIR
jgi:predicted nucleic acid-binding protein